MFDTEIASLESFRGRKVTVMGLGLFGGGQGVTEFLCAQGADVTVTDLRTDDALRPSVDALCDLPLRWVLGRHEESDFLQADLVIASPAVPREAPLLDLCRRRGIALETEMNLFFKYCRGKICAVTGSNGKTTTTSLIATMAATCWPNVRLGGNLGKSLLPEVASIGADEWVVLELSSFQLEDLASLEHRPEVSLVTNVTPNHLDRHRTYPRYLQAKRHILEAGEAPNIAVLNGEDPRTRAWGDCGRRCVFFGRTGSVWPRHEGAWVDAEAEQVTYSCNGERTVLFATKDIPLRGRFNHLNAAAAAAAAVSMGVTPEHVREGLGQFRPVEHRLEPVVEDGGIHYVNDSVSTTPESTLAALEALGPDLVLICGGTDKGCSFGSLGRAATRLTRAVILLGQTAPRIADCIPKRAAGPTVRSVGSLEEAVTVARQLAQPGDTILLSPACPSYDHFRNFDERGQRFKQLARC